MYIWTQMSVDYANQRNYLDELFKVYPISPNLKRELNPYQVDHIITAFHNHDNTELVKLLLVLELFPVKDSYVAYLKRDPKSIDRNPQTVNRIAGNLYDMGINDILEKCTAPKETNRQIGPLFKNWLNKGTLGVRVLHSIEEFMSIADNAVLNVSDAEMKKFAQKYFSYDRNKGLDFIARFNNTYVIGEAKFLTDFGGHQNAQFDDAVSTMTSSFRSIKLNAKVIPVAILDGVLYIPGGNKLYCYLENHPEQIIISSLLLREFLYSL